MNLTATQLALAVGIPRARAVRWTEPLNLAMRRFGITTAPRAAAFLAQIGHESAGLARVEENLNYSAPRLLEVFGARIREAEANTFARNPEALANRVYGGRADLGNGPADSGDGWRFRGRGLIQVTGRSNYARMAVLLGLPLMDQPELLTEAPHAAASGAAFWRSKSCNALADAGDFEGITRRINGGLNGQSASIATDVPQVRLRALVSAVRLARPFPAGHRPKIQFFATGCSWATRDGGLYGWLEGVPSDEGAVWLCGYQNAFGERNCDGKVDLSMIENVGLELNVFPSSRVASQRDPDGTPYAPRRPRLRDKKRRLRRAMFARLRGSKYLRATYDENSVAIGFEGRTARIARVHHYGKVESPEKHGPKVRYLQRRLLGTTATADRVRQRIIQQLPW